MTSFQTQIRLQRTLKIALSLTLNLLIFTVMVFGFSFRQALAQPFVTGIPMHQLAQVNYQRTDLNSRNSAQEPDTNGNLIENTREKLKETAENVREKLNLDEPISPSTKEFAHDVKEKIGETLSGSEKTADNYYGEYQYK
ncbi:MAG: YtxH domain-containing protein [Oscillatoriales cyanobacterium C42_A2020_001]|nr:YtxH domain-containing protein [Leptolyngbyaceae cyanobacterium C42_A2020_001]